MAVVASGARCRVRAGVVDTALFQGGRWGVRVQCLLWPLCRRHIASMRRHADGLRMNDGLFWRIER